MWLWCSGSTSTASGCTYVCACIMHNEAAQPQPGCTTQIGRILWCAGAAHFLSIMNQGDVMTMSAQLQRSRLFKAAGQLVGVARCGPCLMYTAFDALSFSSVCSISSLTTPSPHHILPFDPCNMSACNSVLFQQAVPLLSSGVMVIRVPGVMSRAIYLSCVFDCKRLQLIASTAGIQRGLSSILTPLALITLPGWYTPCVLASWLPARSTPQKW